MPLSALVAVSAVFALSTTPSLSVSYIAVFILPLPALNTASARSCFDAVRSTLELKSGITTSRTTSSTFSCISLADRLGVSGIPITPLPARSASVIFLRAIFPPICNMSPQYTQSLLRICRKAHSIHCFPVSTLFYLHFST